VIQLLSTETYFELLQIPYPSNQAGVIEKFISEKLIIKEKSRYAITKLGAILFAKNLNDFDDLSRKAVRPTGISGSFYSRNEDYRLPPINILVDEFRTTVTIYSYTKLSEMSRKDKINACYQHCCLRYTPNEKMTNQSLRERYSKYLPFWG
jgi:predicted HTH transcriptional regulator